MIYYSTNGNFKSDRLLVCIHGLTANHTMFSDFIEELSKLDMLIIAPDLRGCGESIGIDGKFTIDEAVDDTKEILNNYKNHKVILLGYSQGGTVAQLFAKKYPEEISGLILCNTFAQNTITFRELVEAYVMKFILQLFGLKVFSNLITSALKKEGMISDRQMENFRLMIRKNNKKAIVGYTKEMISFDSRPWLNEIHEPCLIVRGQNDNAVPLHHTNMLSKSIPNSKTVVVENAGHGMIWTHTKEFAKIIHDNFSLFD